MKLIGIIGAMEVEVASLKEMMTDVTIRTKASMEFNHGYLNGKEVVVVRSGIGKVNAGICTQILVDDYGVDCVINTGIAGSLRNEINIGDIVISTDAVQHDMDVRIFGYPLGEIPQMGVLSFPADEHLAEVAEEVCKEVNPEIQVFRGRVSKSVKYIKANTLMSEMEQARIKSTNLDYLNKLTKLDLLVIDDFGLMDLDLDKCRDLFEVLDTRDGRKSTVVISQFPVSTWFDMFADNTYADACLTRITDKHHTYRLEMNGINMRETE